MVTPTKSKYLTNPIQIPTLWLTFILALVATLVSEQKQPIFGNQYTYLLKLIANSAIDHSLSLDWQVNTIDIMPVFTALTTPIFNSFGDTGLIALSYLATGIFYFSLLLIAAKAIDIKKSTTTLILFFCFLLIVNSSTLFDGQTLRKVTMQGFADQYLIKGYFQPSMAGTLLLLSIALHLWNKKYLSILALATGATIHPTYILPAGILTCAFMVSDFLHNKSLVSVLKLGGLAALLTAPTAISTALLTTGGDPATAAAGRDIFANIREWNHGHIKNWRLTHTAIQAVILAGGIWLSRKSRLFPILTVSTAISVSLVILKEATGSDYLTLLFPHRVSACLIPIATILLLAKLATALDNGSVLRKRLQLATFALLALTAAWGGITYQTITDREKYFTKRNLANEDQLIEKVITSRQPNSIYIVPTDMLWFRADTLTPIVVDFRTHPYTAIEMVEWYKRIQAVDAVYEPGVAGAELCEKISAISSTYAATHILYPSSNELTACGFSQLYAGLSYDIYTISNR